ncbi:MAG TPA: right-handed parallel beta-helix repeat-containing protein [Gaiellaceae bacterium]|nr:right-handed parallel beta-helix repeat-containing protein [Gaiellaceae bacterium]
MSYTLRGRVESRLAASLLPFLVACALAGVLREWWPLELAGLMVGVGLALDLGLYHRLLAYQPAWAAVPMGLLELAAVMTLVRGLGVEAPLWPALGFFAGSWLLAQVLGHAAFPLLALSYGDDGGELGRPGTALTAAAPLLLAAVLGAAWVSQPPTLRLPAGVYAGPLVLDRAQTLVGERGAVVRGGIVVTADDVTVRDVHVIGGEFGIEVRDAEDVTLERVVVSGAELDGINARRSTVTIRDCRIESLRSEYAQGIDISFGFDLGTNVVEGCTVTGGQEGIVSHFAHVDVRRNTVTGTTQRAITLTEMSMGRAVENHVRDVVGVGIFCGDYSECRVERNVVVGVRPDRASGDRTKRGYGVQSHYHSRVIASGNRAVLVPHPEGTYLGARIERG